jgi:hypothetical protein
MTYTRELAAKDEETLARMLSEILDAQKAFVSQRTVTINSHMSIRMTTTSPASGARRAV